MHDFHARARGFDKWFTVLGLAGISLLPHKHKINSIGSCQCAPRVYPGALAAVDCRGGGARDGN